MATEQSATGRNEPGRNEPQRSEARPPAGRPDWVVRLTPSRILLILLIEFTVLLLLPLCYQFRWLYVDRLPAVIADVMPLAVPWGGALGGVCIGLVGVTSHWSKWGADPARRGRPSRQALRFNAWYLVRLPLGAAFGMIAALIVVLFLGTIARTEAGGVNVDAAGAASLMVVAFIVGYQQDVFRQLVARVVEVVLGPGATTADDEAFSLDTARVQFPATTVGSASTKLIEITNEGRQPLVVAPDQVVVQGDAFAASHVPANLPGGDTGQLEITFRPTAPQSYLGSVTVSLNGASRLVSLAGTGTAGPAASQQPAVPAQPAVPPQPTAPPPA